MTTTPTDSDTRTGLSRRRSAPHPRGRALRRALTMTACVLPLLATSLAFAQPRPGRRGPPPDEAIVACEGLSEGDACSFESPRGTVTGTCVAPPSTTTLACAPADRGERRDEK